MTRYRYVKEYTSVYTFPYKIFSFFFICIGSSVLLWTLWPIASFILFTATQFHSIVSPVPETYSVSTSRAGITALAESSFLLASKTITGTDYTNPNAWYPNLPQRQIASSVNSYTLSIPSLGIQNAMVVIYGSDLNTSLIHYGGTGLPGEYGNSVIFGHSTLPQFFNPKDYKAIFSTLPNINIGDDVIITFDTITYRYSIFDITVTMPNDLSPLEQKYDDSYITIVTCVPPGTYAKRLNVKARLITI